MSQTFNDTFDDFTFSNSAQFSDTKNVNCKTKKLIESSRISFDDSAFLRDSFSFSEDNNEVKRVLIESCSPNAGSTNNEINQNSKKDVNPKVTPKVRTPNFNKLNITINKSIKTTPKSENGNLPNCESPKRRNSETPKRLNCETPKRPSSSLQKQNSASKPSNVKLENKFHSKTNEIKIKETGYVFSQSAESNKLSAWGLPDNILQKYESRNIVQMFAWQVECLTKPDVLSKHKNLVYSAPTSAGKTLVAEILSIKTVLERQKKVIFILPFVSVVREKMFYFQDIFGTSGVRVEGYMGSYNPPGGFKTVQVAICTIEKANSLINRLMDEGKLSDIGAVIVDEMHLLGDPGRGYLLELLLTKLRYMSLKDKEVNIQIVGMSATLPNLPLLAKWLDAELYTTDFRPIPLFEQCHVLGEIYNNDLKLIRKIQALPELDTDSDNLLQLCLETINESCSVLIFCPTKNWCENLAQQLAAAFWKLGGSKTNLGKKFRDQLNISAIKECMEQLKACPVGLDDVLGRTVGFGVGFHHAGLTMDERDIVEGAFRLGTLRVLIATSTLSSGVNLPARRVIIRSPMFFGKPINILTYRQMIGRAGRMGKDTAGESVLICQKNECNVAKELMSAKLQPVESCLEGAGKLKRAILEVITSDVASTPDEIDLFTKCTLLAQDDYDNEINNPIEEAVGFLIQHEFIRLQIIDEGQSKYIATSLAKACLSSSLPPEEGLALFTELEKARQCFVLETELHLIYLVTPYTACNQLGNIDWMMYLEMWEKLPASMKRVGDLVGIKISYIINCTRGKLQSNTSKAFQKLQIHKRFYTALILQDLVNEIPLNKVANKYGCNRGMLQSLQQSAATFAGMVTSFSKQLGWSSVELLVAQFQDRLQFGISRDLLDLMKLTLLNGQRARALYNAGIENLVDLAGSDLYTLENILHKSRPFESGKEREGESEHDAKKRNTMRSIWITGKQGVTEREAAKMLIEEARQYLQLEMGLSEAKWGTLDDEEDVRGKEEYEDDSIKLKEIVNKETPSSLITAKADVEAGANLSTNLINEENNDSENAVKTVIHKENNKINEVAPEKVYNSTKHKTNEDSNDLVQVSLILNTIIHKQEENTQNGKIVSKDLHDAKKIQTPLLSKIENKVDKINIKTDCGGIAESDQVILKKELEKSVTIPDKNNAANVSASTKPEEAKKVSNYLNQSIMEEDLWEDESFELTQKVPTISNSPIPSNLVADYNIDECSSMESFNSPLRCELDEPVDTFEASTASDHISDKAITNWDSLNLSSLSVPEDVVVNQNGNNSEINEAIANWESLNEASFAIPKEKVSNTDSFVEIDEPVSNNTKDNAVINWDSFDVSNLSIQLAEKVPEQLQSVTINKLSLIVQKQSPKSLNSSSSSNRYNLRSRGSLGSSNQSLFEDSFGYDSKLIDGIENQLPTNDSLLANEFMDTFSSPGLKILTNKCKSDVDSATTMIKNDVNLIETQNKVPNDDCIIISKTPDSRPVETLNNSSSSRKRGRNSDVISSDNDTYIGQTPNKKTKVSKRLHRAPSMNIDSTFVITESKPILAETSIKNEIESVADLTKLEIINVRNNKLLFDCFCKELRLQNEISMAVACEKIIERKPSIGERILKRDSNENANKKFSHKEIKLIGIAVSWGSNTAYYIEVVSDETVAVISDILSNNKLVVRMFDSKQQSKILKLCCEIDLGCIIEDPKIADWLLDPEAKEKNLQAMTLTYAPEAIKLCQLAGNNKGVGSISLELNSSIEARIRVSVECLVSWHLMESLRNALVEENLQRTFSIEMSCISILSKMEVNGFGIDIKLLQNLADELKAYCDNLESKAYQLAGRRFSFLSSMDVAKVIGLFKGKRISTNKQVLENNDHPISKLILLWRKINSTLTKMVYPLLRMVDKNRIHGTCITHSSTGRISMHEPNLQNIPRDFTFANPLTGVDINICCRKAFVAQDKNILVSADYCQLELRILAHLSQDDLLCSIMQNNNDVFKSIASKWNNISEDEVNDEIRQRAKQICYGIIYGMGNRTLAEQLLVSEDEAAEFTETFHQTYPGIKKFIQATIYSCKEQGYVETISGRRRYLPNINDSSNVIKSQAERQAVNTTVQGSAADIAKNAMVLVENKIKEKFKSSRNTPKLVLQLHDELIYEVASKYSKIFAKILKKCMQESVKLSVPFPVKLKTGKSWGTMIDEEIL